ncbi:unnamed protein product [Heterobilharzia americana]|nr:unnamed protein product [Heterobilharzia americana]
MHHFALEGIPIEILRRVVNSHAHLTCFSLFRTLDIVHISAVCTPLKHLSLELNISPSIDRQTKQHQSSNKTSIRYLKLSVKINRMILSSIVNGPPCSS